MARARTANAALARVFQEADRPVYVLDGQRRIVFCNAACVELLGVDLELLIGQRCDFTTTAGLQPGAKEAALLCPPPAVFSGGFVRGEVATSKGADIQSHDADFLGFINEEGDLSGVVAVLTPKEHCQQPDPLLPATQETLHRQLQIQRQHHRPAPLLLTGDSPHAARLRAQTSIAASTTGPLVVSGADGSGCGRLARHIYACRSTEPWLIPVDCAMIDPEMLQTTLTSVFAGRLQHNASPTLLLQDVDKLPPPTQQELAGFLTLPTFDLATIATSSQKLSELDAFDPVLALQLTAQEIELPALVDRLADIPLLAQAKLELLNRHADRQLAGFSHGALEQLCAYHWPGEMAEFHQVVEQAYQVAENVQVESQHLPAVLRHAALARELQPATEEDIELDGFLESIERELIERALAAAGNNKSAASKKLSISRARLLRRIAYLFDGAGEPADDG